MACRRGEQARRLREETLRLWRVVFWAGSIVFRLSCVGGRIMRRRRLGGRGGGLWHRGQRFDIGAAVLFGGGIDLDVVAGVFLLDEDLLLADQLQQRQE